MSLFYRSLFITCLFSATFLVASTASAQPVFFNDRASFEAAAASLSTEDFEEAVVGGTGDSALFFGPLDDATNNGVFAPGQIESGLTIFAVTNPGTEFEAPTKLGVVSHPHFGVSEFPSKAISPASNDVGVLVFNFTSATAVGFDVYYERVDVGVKVFTTGNVPLDVEQQVTGNFFGVISDVPITRIEIDAPFGILNGSFEVADNVSFGAASTGGGEPLDVINGLIDLVAIPPGGDKTDSPLFLALLDFAPNNQSAAGRVGATLNKLNSVRDLILANDTAGACDEVQSLLGKFDGQGNDWGSTVDPVIDELVAGLMDLSDALCP